MTTDSFHHLVEQERAIIGKGRFFWFFEKCLFYFEILDRNNVSSFFNKKVAKIKAQLDTFKSEDRYATLQKAFISQPPPAVPSSTSSIMINTSSSAIKNPVKTPTVPHVGENTLHPNTPNYGFEFSTPPNLKTSASANYFPILTSAVTSSSISDPRSSTSSGHGGDTADSASPLSSSPNRTSPFTTTTTASTNSSAASTTNNNNNNSRLPPFLPLMTSSNTGQILLSGGGGSSSRSGSPSTLSPASSNSLPSVSRPQNLKLPQSHSLNAFPKAATSAIGGAAAVSEASSAQPDDLNRLIFFFDVMSTQEKIAKVYPLLY